MTYERSEDSSYYLFQHLLCTTWCTILHFFRFQALKNLCDHILVTETLIGNDSHIFFPLAYLTIFFSSTIQHFSCTKLFKIIVMGVATLQISDRTH